MSTKTLAERIAEIQNSLTQQILDATGKEQDRLIEIARSLERARVLAKEVK